MEVDRPKAPLKTLSITDVGSKPPTTTIPGHEELAIEPGCLAVLDRQALAISGDQADGQLDRAGVRRWVSGSRRRTTR